MINGEDDMEAVYIVIVVVAVIVIVLLTILIKINKGDGSYNNHGWVSREEFLAWKMRIKPGCDELELIQFRDFLESYGGGFVKRSRGKIVRHEYLGQEKGDLKGIYFNIIVPSPHISVARKEEFRQYLNDIGVNGVEHRPNYETRDSKLKNRKTDLEDRARKDVGNKGELIVREALSELGNEYSVINGPVLKFLGITKEFDHIVVGYNGVFIIETKAFGMSNGKMVKAGLFVDDGDKWIVRVNKKNREVLSPSKQILDEKEFITKLLSSYASDIYALVSLSNIEINLKQNIELPYEVLKADEINEYIKSKPAFLNESDRQTILTSINNCRIN